MRHLIAYTIKERNPNVVLVGDQSQVLTELDAVTERLERTGCFFVKEEKIDQIIIREFATEENGHVLDLIICDGMAEDIKKVVH
jgi:hypothetical protein